MPCPSPHMRILRQITFIGVVHADECRTGHDRPARLTPQTSTEPREGEAGPRQNQPTKQTAQAIWQAVALGVTRLGLRAGCRAINPDTQAYVTP